VEVAFPLGYFFFFLLVVLGFELGSLHLLGGALPPKPFCQPTPAVLRDSCHLRWLKVNITSRFTGLDLKVQIDVGQVNSISVTLVLDL
jgi:hypothetical protein